MQFRERSNLIYGLFFIVQTVLAVLIALSYSYNVSGVEQNVLYSIQRTLISPTDLFMNTSAMPYAVTQYSPLYYILCDWTNRLLGWEAGVNAHQIQVTARILSISALFVALSFIKSIAKFIFELPNWIIPMILLLIMLSTAPWYYICRIDALLFLFEFAALYFALAYLNEEEHKSKLILIAGIMSFLAIASKQSGLITPTIIGSYVFIQKDFKAFFQFKLGLLLGLIITSLIIWPYYSSNIWDNCFGGVASNGFSIKNVLLPLNNYLSGYAVFGLLAVILGYYFYKEKSSISSISQTTLLLFYAFISHTVFAFATSFKYGSDVNYYHNSMVLSLLLGAIFLHQLKEGKLILEHLKAKNLLLAVFVFVALLSNYQIYNLFIKQKPNNYLSQERPVSKDLVDFVKNELKENQYFLSFNAALNNELPEHCAFPHRSITRLTSVQAKLDLTDYKNTYENGGMPLLIAREVKQEYMGVNWKSKVELIREFGAWKVYRIYAKNQ